MATVAKWEIDSTQAVVEEGVTRSLTKIYRVDGVTQHGDERALWEALATPGIPQHGEKAAGNTNLAVHRHTLNPVPGTPTSVRVVVEYETVADYRNSFIFSGGASLNQVQTDVDIYGNKISLSYTYPNDYHIEALQGQPLISSINESVYVPRSVCQATGSLHVDYPNQIVEDWAWHMNSTFWNGWAAGYWMCTSCDYTARDIGPGRAHLWEFTWTFELNPLGWPVISKIIDPNKGEVPPDVVYGVGIKPVDWYPSRNFNDIFGNT